MICVAVITQTILFLRLEDLKSSISQVVGANNFSLHDRSLKIVNFNTSCLVKYINIYDILFRILGKHSFKMIYITPSRILKLSVI